jgi:hypothetical protein
MESSDKIKYRNFISSELLDVPQKIICALRLEHINELLSVVCSSILEFI